jgi:hypothetical protein
MSSIPPACQKEAYTNFISKGEFLLKSLEVRYTPGDKHVV